MKRAMLVLAFVAMATLMIVGSSQAKTGKIIVMPKLIGIPIFDVFEEGAKAAGQDLGIEVVFTGPTKADATEQARMLEDLIAKGDVVGITIAPNDPAVLTPVLKKAKARGIVVTDWDTRADPSVVDATILNCDDREFGITAWDLLVKYMGTDSGEYALLTGGLTANNLNTWINYGLEYAKTKYPNLKLVTDKIPTDEKTQLAYQKALDLIKAYPNLKGIIGISTPAPIGAAQAVQEKGLQDKITVVGTILPSSGKPFIADGSLDAGYLYDPFKTTYAAVWITKQIIDRKPLKDGMEIPKVGKIRLLPDGKTIIAQPTLVITKENIDNYNF